MKRQEARLNLSHPPENRTSFYNHWDWDYIHINEKGREAYAYS